MDLRRQGWRSERKLAWPLAAMVPGVGHSGFPTSQTEGCSVLTLPRTATTLTRALASLPPPAFTLPSCSHPLQSPAREPFLKTPHWLASYVGLTAAIRMVTQC